eukprot:SAG11_NODE_4942_length_1715_cov_16.908416_2_plen_56_part_01
MFVFCLSERSLKQKTVVFCVSERSLKQKTTVPDVIRGARHRVALQMGKKLGGHLLE